MKGGAGVIPKNFIQDLLNRLDIVDVIERYVPLKKAGANFVACCPFHSEKSPSFTVSQTKQFYHCFGCGAHGTAIGFVMEHAGLGYVDAIEELARSVGLEVPHERQSAGESYQKVAPDLYEVMQTATRYYREQLKQSPPAIDYLKRRGLSGEIAAKFGIGYAPDGWQNLAAAFPDYQDDTLNETGLVITGDEGKRYDRFRDRIMFPIVNVRGQVIGFGGRVLDKGEPKYLNSPETSLFEKGRELYGLFQAQKTIRAEQRVLVVEGYMDVVALAQHGVEYAVATLGTATTPFHVQKLLRLTEHIVFCLTETRPDRRRPGVLWKMHCHICKTASASVFYFCRSSMIRIVSFANSARLLSNSASGRPCHCRPTCCAKSARILICAPRKAAVSYCNAPNRY